MSNKQRKTEKRKKKRKQYEKRKNIAKHTKIEQEHTSIYDIPDHSVEYKDLDGYMLWDKPVMTTQDSKVIQSITFASLKKLRKMSEKSLRQSFVDYSYWAKRPGETVQFRAVTLKGTVFDYKFGKMYKTDDYVLKGIMLINVKVYDHNAKKWIQLDDSHCWLYFSDYIPRAKTFSTYLCDSIIVDGVVRQYERDKKGSTEKKWGIGDWYIVDSFQEYALDNELLVQKTPSAIPRNALMFTNCRNKEVGDDAWDLKVVTREEFSAGLEDMHACLKKFGETHPNKLLTLGTA